MAKKNTKTTETTETPIVNVPAPLEPAVAVMDTSVDDHRMVLAASIKRHVAAAQTHLAVAALEMRELHDTFALSHVEAGKLAHSTTESISFTGYLEKEGIPKQLGFRLLKIAELVEAHGSSAISGIGQSILDEIARVESAEAQQALLESASAGQLTVKDARAIVAKDPETAKEVELLRKQLEQIKRERDLATESAMDSSASKNAQSKINHQLADQLKKVQEEADRKVQALHLQLKDAERDAFNRGVESVSESGPVSDSEAIKNMEATMKRIKADADKLAKTNADMAKRLAKMEQVEKSYDQYKEASHKEIKALRAQLEAASIVNDPAATVNINPAPSLDPSSPEFMDANVMTLSKAMMVMLFDAPTKETLLAHWKIARSLYHPDKGGMPGAMDLARSATNFLIDHFALDMPKV